MCPRRNRLLCIGWRSEGGSRAAGFHRPCFTGAVARARLLGRDYLRLDCEASRMRLRTVYETFGFRHHSDRQVGPYFVSRYEYEVGG